METQALAIRRRFLAPKSKFEDLDSSPCSQLPTVTVPEWEKIFSVKPIYVLFVITVPVMQRA